jgi:hypothetical protein
MLMFIFLEAGIRVRMSFKSYRLYQHVYISTTVHRRGKLVSGACRKRPFGRNRIRYSEVGPTEAFRAGVKYKLEELGRLAVISKGLAKDRCVQRPKLGDDDQELELSQAGQLPSKPNG